MLYGVTMLTWCVLLLIFGRQCKALSTLAAFVTKVLFFVFQSLCPSIVKTTMLSLDEDGDCVVVRREKTASQQGTHETVYDDLVLSDMHIGSESTLGIEHKSIIELNGHGRLCVFHSIATPLDKVGLQVWRGAAILVDYLLSLKHQVQGSVVLELGAGTGLVSLAAGLAGAHAVFATDAFHDVLYNCLRNVESNGLHGRVFARKFDWMEPPPWVAPACSPPQLQRTSFAWHPTDVEQLRSVDVILAADVIYDNTLTEAFMRLALVLMTGPRRSHNAPPCVLLVAVERRECFTLRDMDVKSPAYEYWRSLFVSVEASSETRKLGAVLTVGSWVLFGKRLELDSISKCVRGYERTDLLELWELKASTI
jgi:predicted nicotinamide N-methyase